MKTKRPRRPSAKALSAMLALLVTGLVLGASQVAPPAVRFTHVDVFIDSAGAALGAYQVELKPSDNRVTLVGVEGGDPAMAAFAEPPYYDPAALNESSRGRVILAALHAGGEAPSGSTRVARIHVRVVGGGAPEFETKIAAAANPAGERIEATVTLRTGEDK
ncbi:MAG: hypothetical protein ACKVU4_05830 [Phycisphaerales bacterium]